MDPPLTVYSSDFVGLFLHKVANSCLLVSFMGKYVAV